MPRLVIAALFLFSACRPAPVRVLFVGNSFVSVNDLPKAFAALAASKGARVEADSAARGADALGLDPAQAHILQRAADEAVLTPGRN